MNPVIEFYKKTRNEDGVLKEEFAKIDVAVFSKQVLEVLHNATGAERNEFIAWTEALPPTKEFREAEKDAAEVRKRLKWEHKQNQLPGQFPNDKYAG